MKIIELTHDSEFFDVFYNRYSSVNSSEKDIFEYNFLKAMLEYQKNIPDTILANFYFKIIFFYMNNTIVGWMIYSYFPDINSAFIEDLYTDPDFSDFNINDILFIKFYSNIEHLMELGQFRKIDNIFMIAQNDSNPKTKELLKFLKKQKFYAVDFVYQRYFAKNKSIYVLTENYILSKKFILEGLYFHMKYIENIFNPTITLGYKNMLLDASDITHFHLTEISC